MGEGKVRFCKGKWGGRRKDESFVFFFFFSPINGGLVCNVLVEKEGSEVGSEGEV